MERLRLAALNQNDDMTQMPMIVQPRQGGVAHQRGAGDRRGGAQPGATPHKRGVLWEATTAITLAMSGADVLVMRHPEAVAPVRKAIDGLLDQ